MCPIIRYSWGKTSQSPQITGVPLHVMMLAKIKQLEVKLDEMAGNFESKLKEEFKNFVCNTGSGAVENKVIQALEDQNKVIYTLI
mmetsp:Transcript_9465/g.9574  ORF Transcript_9465/g.9574 Transcript_9465/m.9574 type:complete len:85 (+) Transcript_9465:466-720(+)|eukprot:CAMPEP_0171321458 /NCGR_PEP_ID=MMETSP0816-20121228/112291_1 /TAXON_ID=420281 /ORGANISM="Proboscia inermis, Strain CCAP1064/1" /LENGTH=84 /DNA_ID=CAMNT_0011819463 /DNA_START=456 /DNA_END=710 /DNA_ORIENTATION=+